MKDRCRKTKRLAKIHYLLFSLLSNLIATDDRPEAFCIFKLNKSVTPPFVTF